MKITLIQPKAWKDNPLLKMPGLVQKKLKKTRIKDYPQLTTKLLDYIKKPV